MIPSAGPVPSWTFRLILPPRLNTSSCSTMVPPNPSPRRTCRLSSPNHEQLTPILPRHTFSLHFFVSTPRLRSTMKVNITMVSHQIARWGIQLQLQISCQQETTQLERPSSQPSYHVAGPVRQGHPLPRPLPQQPSLGHIIFFRGPLLTSGELRQCYHPPP